MPQPGPNNLKIRISSQGGHIDKHISDKSIIIISPGCDDQISPEELQVLSTTHNIYNHAIIDGLLMRPEALEEEQYIKVRRQRVEGEEELVGDDEDIDMDIDNGEEVDDEEEEVDEEMISMQQRGRELENMAAKVDKRRLWQPAPKNLSPKERRWLSMSQEAYLARTYCGQANEHLAVVIKGPVPALPGAPLSKRRDPFGTPYRDLFWAPPISLADCSRAADPVRREYMQSEDFALLMWYTRTIPYCGVSTPEEELAHFRFNGATLTPYRWNWARTHGVVLRSLTSILERWRHQVQTIFFGKGDIPSGTFRRMLAESEFFVFNGDRILGYHIKKIRAANLACASRFDSASHDTLIRPDPNDDAREQALQDYINRLDADVHNGQRWLSSASSSSS